MLPLLAAVAGMAVVLGFLLGQESSLTSAKVGNIVLLNWTFQGRFFGGASGPIGCTRPPDLL